MATTLAWAVALLFLLLDGSLLPSTADAADTITASRPLSGNQKVESRGDKFALGPTARWASAPVWERGGRCLLRLSAAAYGLPIAAAPCQANAVQRIICLAFAGFPNRGRRRVGGPPNKWYIAIWYNKVSIQAAVWIANREAPISNPYESQLTISQDGALVLYDQSRSVVWSSNVPNVASSNVNSSEAKTVAVLLNTGNLILSQASNMSHVLWQSFDHLTDTLLPNMKIGLNKVTGARTRLVAWRNQFDPSPGIFSVEMDRNDNTQYIFLWNNSQPYFTGGKYDPDTGAFSGIPEMTPMRNSMYTFQYVNNSKEAYFMLTVKNDNILFRLTIDASGQARSTVWMENRNEWMLFFLQPKAKCAVYSMCGAFSRCRESSLPPCSCLKGFHEQSPNSWISGNYAKGCTRNVGLQCHSNSSAQKAREDRFYVMNNVKLPDWSHSVPVESVGYCKVACLNNCSCSAYSYNGTCLLWYTDLVNLQDSLDDSGDTIFIRLAASELPDSKTKKLRVVFIIIGGLIALVCGVTACTACICLVRKRTMKAILPSTSDGRLATFKYSDLQLITKGFSEKLGSGSFGSVFKGVLPDKTVVAVKKLEGLHQGEKQFRAEMSTIGTIHHIHLVRLLGFCSHGTQRMLVYEHMHNGSLDRHLFGNNSGALGWSRRYQIAVGVAKGLAYLHEKCRDCIIHCDIKPENILLDVTFVPKVADFGLAKLLGRDFSRVLTSMRGTIGYLAPEWISGMAITTKADVFSYGMLLFEIISQRRNIEKGEQGANMFFPVLVAKKLLEGDLQALLEPESVAEIDLEELARACKIACWCVQDEENSRPSMGEIVQILEGFVDVSIPPIPRYLHVLAERADLAESSVNE
uniref:Receptor-like serine/threonine-protein kinase n=1 Tax=Leersia perrieri TaxID=77586 RepID=A0A0D9WGJ7_9ORYZ